MERGSGTKGCTKFRSRTGFEKRRLKLPFDFSRTFFVKVATRFAGFVKEHVLKTVSSFCAILYLLRLFFKESKPFLNEQRCRSPLPRNFQHCTCKNFPTSHTISPLSSQNRETLRHISRLIFLWIWRKFVLPSRENWYPLVRISQVLEFKFAFRTSLITCLVVCLSSDDLTLSD